MGIYRRGRIWWIDFYDQNRNRIQESSQSVHRRDAERLLGLRKSESLRGIYRRPVKVTLADFAKRYMEHAKANKRSWLRDEQMLERLQEFFGAGRQLSDIGAADVEGYKLQRRASVSGSTVNRELALLKRIFNLATAWDLYQDTNPVRKVKFFREFNTGLRVLSEEEEGMFLQYATPLIQDVARFALNTGLRIGEVFSLCWPQVDMEKRILSIVAPKTGKMREVPINAEALKVLQAWSHSKRIEFVIFFFGIVAGSAIHTATRCINKCFYPCFFCLFCQFNRSTVINIESDFFESISHWVVGNSCQVNNGINTFK